MLISSCWFCSLKIPAWRLAVTGKKEVLFPTSHQSTTWSCLCNRGEGGYKQLSWEGAGGIFQSQSTKICNPYSSQGRLLSIVPWYLSSPNTESLGLLIWVITEGREHCCCTEDFSKGQFSGNIPPDKSSPNQMWRMFKTRESRGRENQGEGVRWEVESSDEHNRSDDFCLLQRDIEPIFHPCFIWFTLWSPIITDGNLKRSEKEWKESLFLARSKHQPGTTQLQEKPWKRKSIVLMAHIAGYTVWQGDLANLSEWAVWQCVEMVMQTSMLGMSGTSVCQIDFGLG